MGNVGFCYCISIGLHSEMADYLGHGFVNLTYFFKKTGIERHLNSQSYKLHITTLRLLQGFLCDVVS